MKESKTLFISACAVGFGIMGVAWLASQSWIQEGAAKLDLAGGGGFVSALLFAMAFAILATFMVPSSMMKLLMGAVLGFGWGTMAAWIGSMLGAIPGFIIGRHIMAKKWQNYSEDKALFKAVENSIVENGIRTIIIVRLSLILPYNVLNYVLGATELKPRDYIIGNIATIGPSLVYAWWGSQMSNVAEVATGVEKGLLWWVVMLGSVIITAVFIIHTRKLTMKHLEQWPDEQEQENTISN
jgi:uncharacterized membrane protein YdjX (TVP38/TMEM64 family)